MTTPSPDASLRSRIGRAATSAVRPLGRALRERRAGERGSIIRHERLAAPPTITLTSPSFADGERIPDRFCGWGIGSGVSPALTWENLPEGTERLLLVLEDLDFPSSAHTGIHTVAILAPDGPSGGIVEGELSGRSSRFALLAGYDGRRGYHGPRPLPGHGEHRYVFHLFALGVPISPPPDSDLAALVRTLPPGGVLARGELRGVREA